jgi:ABC-type branched-subunit amino acid transport system substrate-binding protein
VRRFRWLAAVLALVLVAAACGRSDDDKESGGSNETTSTSAASGGGESGDFGTLSDVCQGGNGGGATAQGVTADSIRIGTVSDPGYAGRPGLNQELFDTAEVFSKWCNDRGGINGRKVQVDLLDAALTNYKPQIVKACQDDFYMVGGGAVFDNTGVEDRLKCLLPDVAAYVVTPEARSADLLTQPVPNSGETLPVGDYRWLGEEYPDSTDHVGVLTGSLPATVTTAKQAEEAVKALGWKVVYSDQYPPTGPTSWAPYVQGMKDKGVRGLIWVGEPENLAKFEQALVDANYELDWIRTDANHYDAKLIDVGGAAIKNTFIRSVFYPFEDAKQNPATQQYLDAFAQYKPEGKAKAYLGLQAFSAWLLFAQAAKECGADLTRKCVYDNLQKVHDWTGGGLHSTQDPGANVPGDCFALFEATPEGFELADINPNDGIYSCNPKNAYELTGDYGQGVKLEDVGMSINDLK